MKRILAILGLLALITCVAFTQNYSAVNPYFYGATIMNTLYAQPSTSAGDALVLRNNSGTNTLTVDNSGNLVTSGTISSSGYADGWIYLPATRCSFTPTTTALTAGPLMVAAATGNPAFSATTNTTAGTLEVTCALNVGSRLTSGSGVTVTGVSLLYGIQTTAMSSIANPTIHTVTYPSAGGSAAGTVAAAGGSLTITPGTLQLATTTGGQYYNENISFGTPVALTTDATSLTLDQVFTTAGSTATTLQLGGILVYYKSAIQ